MILTLLVLILLSSNLDCAARVKSGADILVSREIDRLAEKRVGLITNHTGRLSSGEFLVDALIEKKIRITALFGPEHGVRGAAGAGEHVGDGIDSATGIPVYSLYGKNSKPTMAMLDSVDVLVYDIQDVGARFYTYISTLKLSMEAAAQKGIPFLVLDRPNPLGRRVDGPVMEDSLRSFVGIAPLPVMYGLTCGELARMMNELGWLDGGRHADLHVVKMEDWSPSMSWSETGIPWIPPSPNIPTPETMDVYPATCFIEGSNVSEGRGTNEPFQIIGAPFVDGASLQRSLSAMQLPGVRFDAVTFTPTSSKHAGARCNGIRIVVVDRLQFEATRTGLSIYECLLKLYPHDLQIRRAGFLRLMGRADVYSQILAGVPANDIVKGWGKDLQAFEERSSKFRMY